MKFLHIILSPMRRYKASVLFWFSSTLTMCVTVVCNSHLRDEKWYCLKVFILVLVIEVIAVSIDVTTNEN